MDIQALKLLEARKVALKQVAVPANIRGVADFKEFQRNLDKQVADTTKCISDIENYMKAIDKELKNLQSIARVTVTQLSKGMMTSLQALRRGLLILNETKMDHFCKHFFTHVILVASVAIMKKK